MKWLQAMRAHPEKRVLRVLPSLALAAALLASPDSGRAADGVVRVHQSTFNEIAAALGPLSASGRHVLGVDTWFGRIVICGQWHADVLNLQFAISPTGVTITGVVSARYHCDGVWIPFAATLVSSGNVTYQAAQNRIRVTTSSTSIRPVFVIPGWVPFFGGQHISLPFTINVGPSLSFSVPVTTAHMHFETAAGPERLRVTPHNISLVLEQNRIRLQSDVALW
jgi:hypothetical protein